jgi:vacuolar protein sorting-associated protein IST1
MAVQRIQIATNKKSTAVKHQKREIAQLLADHKDEKARIKVEHIIREDFVIEAYEMLELLLELIHERIRQVTSNKEVPTDLKEAVCSLIWAASNVDISEFQEIKKQLTKKYGSEFAKMAETNEGNVVNARLFQKLTYKPPSTKLVMGYLVEIAKGYQVEWTPSESGLPEGGILSDLPMTSPVGFSVPMAPASDLRSAYERTNQVIAEWVCCQIQT